MNFFTKSRLTITSILIVCISTLYGQTPESIYFNFEGTGSFHKNYGSDKSAAGYSEIQGTLSAGGSGAFGSTGLVGSGGSSDINYLQTGWPLNLYGGWTIGFWFDPVSTGSGIHYLFGDSAAFGFACYIDYSVSTDLILTAPSYPGFNNVVIPGAGSAGGKMIHLSYNSLFSQISFYVDGSPLGAVSQPALNLNGYSGVKSNLKLGGHLNLPGLAAGAVLDEFRIYNRSLSDDEILATWDFDFGLSPLALDLATDGLQSPEYTTTWGSTETITVGVRNRGAINLDFSSTNIEVGVIVEGPNPATFSTILNTGNLNSGALLSVDLTTGYDMSADGTYRFITYSRLLSGPPDLDLDNDTSNPILRQQNTVDFLPYQQKFEKFEPGGDGTFGPAQEGILYEGWTASPTSGMTWWVEDANGINENTIGTGPFLDNGKFGLPGGQYVYLESSAGAAAEASFLSPSIDLTGTTKPTIGYSYHAFGSGIGTMYLEGNDGSAWVKIDSVVAAMMLSGDEAWQIRTADLSSFSSILQIRFRAISSGASDGDIALDEIHLFDSYNEDVAVLLPDLPEASICGFSAEEELGIKITNNGSLFLTGFDIHVSQTGPVSSSFTENVGTLIIPPGGTANVRLKTPIDLSVNGTHEIKFWVAIPGDLDATNDTSIANIISNPAPAISAFPYSEDFSAFSSWTSVDWAGDTLNDWIMEPGSWSGSGSAGPIRWRWDDGFPISWISGPTDDHTAGSDGFVYLFPGGTIFTSSKLYSPCIDLRSITEPAMSFWYHMFGSNMGTLSLSVISEISGENLVFSLSGQQQTDNDEPWEQALIDLAPWKNEVVRLQFKGKRKELTSTYMSLDDIRVTDNVPQDVATDLIFPPVSTCGYSSAHQFQVELTNNGIDTLYTIPLNVDVIGPVSSSFTESASLVLLPFSTASYTFVNTADLSVAGVYNVRVISAYPGDVDAANDTAFLSLTNTALSVSYPVKENFETFGVGSPGTYDSNWTGNWYVEEDGVSNTANTGPIGDHTPGGSKYMYQEANAMDTFAVMRTACMVVNPISPLFLDFRFYRYGADLGPLSVIIKSGGESNTAVTISGEQHPEEDLRWLRRVVNINPYLMADDIQIEFQNEKLGVLSDAAIDNVKLFYPDNNDAEALVLQVLPSCTPANTNTVIALFNYGVDFINSMDVEVTSTGPINSSFTETISGTIVPFQAEEFQLSSTLDLSSPGVYEIRLITHLVGDVHTANDTLVLNYESFVPINTFPYFDDLESGIPGAAGFLPQGWAGFPGRNPSWQSARDITPSLLTGPPSNHTTGGQGFVYLENTPSFHSDTSVLLSTCIDLDPATISTPWLRYWYHMHGADMGALALDIITPTAEFNDVWNLAGEQHCAACPWDRADIDLNAWVGEKIQLRFRALSGGDLSDMGLDDIKISEPTGLDAATTAVQLSTGFCRIPDADTVKIRVRNETGLPITGFDVGYEVLGPDAQSFSETLSITIPPFDSIEYSMTEPLTINLGGVHNVGVWIDLAGDLISNNDSIWLNYAWFPSPWNDDFESFLVGEPGILSNGWTRPQTSSDNGWFPELSGVPNTSNTGPIADHTSSTGTYMYLEDPSLIFNEYQLISPCIDLQSLGQPSVDFWYHMYGSGMGDLMLEIEVAEGLLDTIAFYSGQQQTSEPDPWEHSIVSLINYSNQTVRFRLTGTNGGERSDMAIDDFRVGELSSVGVFELPGKNSFHLYPNPTAGKLTLNFTEPLTSSGILSITDQTGKAWLQEYISAGLQLKSIDLQALPNGIYILSVIGADYNAARLFTITD